MTDNTNDPVGVLISALEKLAAQDSGIVASSAKSDCMAATAKAALRNYKAAAIQHSEQRETVPAAAVLSISWPMPRYRMETGYMQPDERGSWCKWIDVHPNMDSPPVAAPVPEAKADPYYWQKHTVFSTNILGRPMREYAPGKWESSVWPSEARAEQAGYPYQALFNSIGAAVEIQGIAKAISVKAFVSALQNEGYQITPAAPAVSPSLHSVKHEASELPPLPKHCIGNGGFNERQMRAYGQACHALGRGAAVRDYCNTGTFNAPPIAVQGSIADDAFILHVRALADNIDWREVEWDYAAQEKFALGIAQYIDSRSPVAAAPEKMPGSFTSAEALFAVIDAKDHAARDAAVRNAALEEAAKACQEAIDKHGIHSNFICINAIRALSAAAPSADAKGDDRG